MNKKILIIILTVFIVIISIFVALIYNYDDSSMEDDLKNQYASLTKYTVKENDEKIVYNYGGYVYVLMETTSLPQNKDTEFQYVGLFVLDETEYKNYKDQEMGLLIDIQSLDWHDVYAYHKAIFYEDKLYVGQFDEIDIYTFDGKKESITLNYEDKRLGYISGMKIDKEKLYLYNYIDMDNPKTAVCDMKEYNCKIES